MQNPPIDVYPYTKFEYNPYQYLDSFYAKKDVCNSLKQAADLGARGVVLWSSSKNMKQRCDGLAEYVRNMLGPTVALIRKRTQRCREKRCSGHGQCVLPSPASRCTFRMQPESYICRCDALYTGKDCLVRRYTQSKSAKNGNDATTGFRNKQRKWNRGWLGRRRRIRIMKVIGDAGSEGSKASNAGAVRVGIVTKGPIQVAGAKETSAQTDQEYTARPPYAQQNIFQRAGWETDDDGNVFVGNDNCKLLLISVGSYWPFPKDYRKK
ncbi:EGF-like domain protein [Teladorsagia circumcincta]|uniref:Hyaluronidase n=1 Tax=Teladorsagia circumcincta TaxID=45464 RepID=A0A2G9U8M1_TELCI|nr:EGF-like domain protein [Teladorsagia circumcincta]